MERQVGTPVGLLNRPFAGSTNVFAQVRSNNDGAKNRAVGTVASTLIKPSPPNLNLECDETLQPFVSGGCEGKKVDLQ
jgi:hypothetical protein